MVIRWYCITIFNNTFNLLNILGSTKLLVNTAFSQKIIGPTNVRYSQTLLLKSIKNKYAQRECFSMKWNGWDMKQVEKDEMDEMVETDEKEETYEMN